MILYTNGQHKDMVQLAGDLGTDVNKKANESTAKVLISIMVSQRAQNEAALRASITSQRAALEAARRSSGQLAAAIAFSAGAVVLQSGWPAFLEHLPRLALTAFLVVGAAISFADFQCALVQNGFVGVV